MFWLDVIGERVAAHLVGDGAGNLGVTIPNCGILTPKFCFNMSSFEKAWLVLKWFQMNPDGYAPLKLKICKNNIFIAKTSFLHQNDDKNAIFDINIASKLYFPCQKINFWQNLRLAE